MRSLLDVFRKISILVAALVIAAYVGNLLIDNPFFNQILKQKINKKLDDYTYLNVKFEAINGRLIPLSLDIYGIELRRKGFEVAAPLFQAKHVQIRLSIWALFLSKKEILEIEVNGPQLELPLPPLADLIRVEKFPELQKKSELPSWPLSRDLPFRQLSWTNASLKVHLPAEKSTDPSLLVAEIAGFDMQITYNGFEDVKLDAAVRQFDLSLEGNHLIRSLELKTRLRQKGEKLESEYLEMRSADLSIDSQMTLDYESESVNGPRLSPLTRRLKGLFLRFQHKVHRADIGILGRFLSVDQTGGDIIGNADVLVHLPLDQRKPSFKIEGQSTSQNATLDGFKLLDSQLAFSINEKGMNFDNAKVYKGTQLLARGHGFIGFSSQVPFEYDIIPVRLSLKQLLSVVKVDDFTAVEAQLVADSISLKGQAKPFEIRIQGLADFKDLTFPLVAELPDRYQKPPSCLLDTELIIKSEGLHINKAEGDCKNVLGDRELSSPVNLMGDFRFDEAEGLDISIQSPRLEGGLLNHFTKFPASGILQARVSIKGPYNKIVIAGEGHSKGFNFGGFAAQQIDAKFRYLVDRDELIIPSFTLLEGNAGRLDLNDVKINIKPPYLFEADVGADKVSSEFFHAGLQSMFGADGLSFAIQSLTGHLEGPLLQPFRYRGHAQYVVQNLRHGEETLFHENSGSLLSEGQSWKLEDAYFRLDQLEARLEARVEHKDSRVPARHILHQLGIGPEDKVHLSVKTIDKISGEYRTNTTGGVNHLRVLPFVGNFFRDQRISGEIRLESELEGPIDRLQGKIEASLEQPFAWGIPISSISVSGFIDGYELHIPELRHSGNALAGRLNIDFGKKDLPFDWYLYLNQLDIRALLGPLFAEDPRNFAYLSAEWTMKGQLKKFWESKGELVLSRLQSKLFRNLGNRTSNLELNSDQPIRIQISPQNWRLAEKKPLKLQGEFFNFEITAGENRLPEHLDIKLQGSLKLDILKSFTPLLETARGELMVEGYLRGSIAKPDISLRVRERKLDPFNMKEWTPLTLGFLDYGPAFTGISLDVEAKTDRVIVHRFRANKGREGTISATGVVGFGGDQQELTRLMVQLDRIEFNRISIPVLKTADTVLSGDLALSGNSVPFHLAGNLKVDRFSSIGNFDLRRELVSSLYESKLTASVNKSSAIEASPLFNLDVAVTADKSISIKSKSLEAVLSANLRVRGTEQQPLLLGQVIADRGTFNYRRLFRISQAVISFDEPVSPPNPRLDIVGETTVNPYQVQVSVNGSLSNPRVTLTSDPAIRDDGSAISSLDIVLLITTGKIPEQANKTAEKASVNEIFSNFLVFAEEPLEKLVDLSGQTFIREVYIDSYLSESEQRPVTRLNVPFNVWNMANAVVQLDDDSNAKLSFEYPIHEGITFSGSLDSKANKEETIESPLPKDTGFDLKFRFGFD